MTDFDLPLRSLQQGHWFKLICGASFQHLPAVRSLTLAYALAGADCIDVSADPAVVAAAQSALQVALELRQQAQQRGFLASGKPWLMVSLNDGEDPHFRKAAFDPATCPPDCSRPCATICPAQAIVFPVEGASGVIDQRCYGCGRCLPVCPLNKIITRSHHSTPAAIAPLVLQMEVDAIEIHTQVGRLSAFEQLWQSLQPWIGRLRLMAISCPDGAGLVDYLWALSEIISPLPCPLIWQTDGRPMSGDIGKGTTHAAIKLGEKVLAARLPGYVQLAGGTNHYTVPKLAALGLLRPTPPYPFLPPEPRIAGIAYGSYARTLLLPYLDTLEKFPGEEAVGSVISTQVPRTLPLETVPDLLWQMVAAAHSLIAPLKALTPDSSRLTPQSVNL